MAATLVVGQPTALMERPLVRAASPVGLDVDAETSGDL
jgi:hypothetical protein